MENTREKTGNRINPILAIPLIILLVLSMLSVWPRLWGIAGFKSSTDKDVTQRTTETESGVRLDYVDSNGNIVNTVDKKYSTIVKTLDEKGQCLKEEYFDADGKPVVLASGYAAVSYTYNEDGKKVTELYYGADGEPVKKSNSYYGIHNLYDEKGNNTAVYYLGPDELPAPNKDGYSLKLSAYNEDNKVAAVAYMDAEGNTVSVPTGESGLINRYNSDGKVSEVIYVDGSGTPIMTTRGYAIEKKSYEDGKLVQVMYCDVNGDPVTLKKGYSGLRYWHGKKFTLNADGHYTFILSMFLNEFHWAVFLVGAALCVIVSKSNRKLSFLFLILYLAFIAYMTLMHREMEAGHINFNLIRSIKQFIYNKSSRIEPLNNMWLFAPLGAVLYKLVPRGWIALVPMLISLCIEVTQSVFGLGAFEMGDIFYNSLGGLIGYLMCRSLWKPEAKDKERMDAQTQVDTQARADAQAQADSQARMDAQTRADSDGATVSE